MNVREIMDTFDKDKLVDLIIEHSDNGWYPLELFLFRADYDYTEEELWYMWDRIYDRARDLEDLKIDMGAYLIRDAAELILTHAKNMADDTARAACCQRLLDELHKASEEDGIGMYGDSEWLYMDLCESIEEFLE